MSTIAAAPERKLDWPVLVGAVTLHILAPFAFFFFSWWGLAAFVLHYLITGFGVTVGYHRLLTHKGFKAKPWVRAALTVMGVLSGQGPPIFWVGIHRKHHQFSDHEGDPHSPVVTTLFFAHVGWTFYKLDCQKYARDLLREPLMLRLNGPLYGVCHLLLLGFLAACGWALGGWWMMLSLVLWGYVLRMVCVFHATWLVNSASHRYGYRNFDTDDGSRNNWLVALLALGEGWHNNHHHDQVNACHGHVRWWEFDQSYWFIRMLERMKLISDVQDGRTKREVITE